MGILSGLGSLFSEIVSADPTEADVYNYLWRNGMDAVWDDDMEAFVVVNKAPSKVGKLLDNIADFVIPVTRE